MALSRLAALLPAVLLALHPLAALHAASRPAVEAENGMVVSSQALASEAGLAMLKAGGNAVDAAVAVGYALAVVNPCCGNIGGGGFMTLHLADGRDSFLNFREMAPAAANADMYLDKDGRVIPRASLVGWRAAAVPGTVAGLDAALTRYGSLPRAQVMAPAIALARDGFILTRGDTDILESRTATFRREANVAAIFLRPDGTPWRPGDRLVQAALAGTLSDIARAGPAAFYTGRIPRAVAASSASAGGLLTGSDFAAYRVTETVPVRCQYRGYVVISAPPPSSGGAAICEILNILEGYDLPAMGFHSAAEVHVTAEAMRHAFLDRNTYLGDPDFVANPLERLLSKEYAGAIRASIDPARATPSRSLGPGTAPHEKPETTHFSVVDKAGNAVAVTTTINGSFGAGVIAGDTGFLMNNEMDDFTIRPNTPNLFGLVQGPANAIAPGKRPLSSMAPTLVTRDGRLFLILGSPGGSRIISVTLEVALNVIDHGMAPQEAVNAPRLHHQWLPDELFSEAYGLSADTRVALEAMGYKVTEQTPWGAAEIIAIGPPEQADGPASSGSDAALSGRMRPGVFYGAHDDRRPAGAALGY
jgi:gamma-glutamyltranspeptidase/glutathione hydrolase